MYKIDSSGSVAGQFSDGDLAAGIPGTILPAEYLNAVQGELVNVIEGAGLTLSKADSTQLAAAIAAKIAVHSDATSVHSATSAATASRIVIRDANGRAKVAAPAASDDIATKADVDALTSSDTVTAATGWTLDATITSLRKVGGIVHLVLRASAGASAAWSAVASLPVGYRPAVNLGLIVGVVGDYGTDSYIGTFDITTGGSVYAGTYDDGAKLAALFAIGDSDFVHLYCSFPAA